MMLKLGKNFNGVIKSLSFIQTFLHYQPFSTSTQTNPILTQYLVESLGFSTNKALSVSKKLTHNRQLRGTKNLTQFNFLQIQNSNNVIAYLTQMGVEKSLIIDTISSVPEILLCNVDKTLKPKFQFFEKLGFSGSDFFQFVKRNPLTMSLGLETCIVPSFQGLKEILGSDHLVVMLFKKSRHIRLSSVLKTMVPNVELLRSYGVRMEAIRKRIMIEPCPFFRNHEYFKEAVIRVEEILGIRRDSSQFLMAVHLLTSVKEETIEAKKQIFRKFGWTELDIITLCRSKPMCFMYSSDMIEKKLRFLMHGIGYEPKFLVSNYLLLVCSLEKRIVPRHKVIVILKEKGLIKKERSLCNVNRLSEDKFLERYVIPFEEVHEVYAENVGISLEMLRKAQR